MKRSAFSLIELLVVIAIMSVLATLGASTSIRVLASYRDQITRDNQAILQTKLNAYRSVVADQARKPNGPFYAKAMKLCGNDDKAAMKMLLDAYLTVNCPQTFVEATSGYPLLGMKPSTRFGNIPQFTTITAQDQSAILLNIILDDAPVPTAVERGFTYFKDATGNPYWFVRNPDFSVTVSSQ